MLTLKLLQDNKQEVIERLKIKNFDATLLVNQAIVLDNKRKSLQSETDALQADANRLSGKIGQMMKEGNLSEANEAKALTAKLKDQVRENLGILEGVEKELHELLCALPNVPHESVPPGKSPADNQIARQGGTIPELENPLPHWDLVKKYGLVDFELGVKLTGAGFPVYMGKGAKLQRALINFFMDEAINAGYLEIMPPLMVNEDSGFGTGQLPDKEGQMYHVTLDNLYLIPTAEVPVTNIYRDVVLQASQLPVKACAYSPCFRREAGSYGKDVRGLNRLHQFDKVEIVQVAHPDSSYQVLDLMVDHVQGLVEKLELPWRVMRLCGGDMSFASALTYDFEVFSAAQERWLEVSSVSCFETFQSNRLKLRFKEGDGKKTRLAHTLNGSALALPRVMAALLENNQYNGGIRIPQVLVPYCGFSIID